MTRDDHTKREPIQITLPDGAEITLVPVELEAGVYRSVDGRYTGHAVPPVADHFWPRRDRRDICANCGWANYRHQGNECPPEPNDDPIPRGGPSAGDRADQRRTTPY